MSFVLATQAALVLNFTVDQPPAGEFQLESVLGGLSFPIAMAFAPDGRLFFNEFQNGNIRIVDTSWTLLSQPFYTLPVLTGGEKGLIGLALDPNFGTNGFVYVFHTAASPLRNKVVRLTAVGDTGTAETVIIDNLPAADNHNGGNIHFGPDGKLYVTIGDTENSALSQDPSSLAGKILRYNSDGTIPVDNPTPGSAVYSLGLRNSFDFTFHPHSNGLWATENGTSVDDEVNLIVADGNYGWPTVTGIAGNPLFIDPIVEFTPTIAPTGIIAVSENSAYPAAYHDNLLFTDFNEGQVRRIVLSGPSLDLLGSLSSAYTGGQGSLIDLTEGPDGYIYVSTFTGIFRLVTSTSSTVVEVRVAGSSNDAEETPAGSINLTSSDLEFMDDGGTAQTHVGMRFANVTVPQGANILNAYLELTTDETGSSPADVEFYAEDGDDAPSFSSSAFDISSRAKTTASVAWSSIPAWTTIGEKHQSPDISTVIQEVVNRPGWASGNALAVLATSAGANNGPRTAESYNGSSANAALLHIEFTTGPDVIPPVRSNPHPTGTLSAGTTQTDTSLDTNEDATCRHSTVPNTAYTDMTDTFGVTGGTSHSDTVSGLADGGAYTFYAKCQDEAINANTDDFAITFDVSDGSATIVEVRVGANKDDSEEKSSGANTYTSSDLEFMEDGGSVQAYVGMRWTNVTVPQGATILSAYLELTTDETGSVPADVEFYAEASDNAVTFSSSNFDISSRAKTAASVVWANIPAWNTIGEAHQSTDISAIIQEVVNRPGWALGNSIAVLAGPRTAESYSGSAANAPLLHIEYTTGPPNSPPTADVVVDATDEDTPVVVTLSGFDDETCDLTFSIVSGPTTGTLGAITDQDCSAGAPNTDTALVTYTPDPNFNGGDSFVYRVTDGAGASDTSNVNVTVSAVNDAPVASAGGPYDGTEDISMNFDGSGSSDADGDPLIYAWDFGDGDSGTGIAPDHAYATPGTYTVTLTVNDGTVSSTPATTTATIANVNDPPVADPGGPYNGAEDIPVVFDGSGSSDVDGNPLTYAWDFGDGSNDTGVGPSHTYAAGGTYTVTLVVNDGTVSSTPATTTATITDVNDPPVADAGGPYDGTEDVPVAFDGSGSSDLDGDPLTYSWDFGDGNTDTGVGPSHTYTAPGIYTVTLTVNDGAVSSTPATTTATITETNDPPVADAGGPYNGTEDVAVAFDGSGSFDIDGDPLTYAWDFGDASSDTGIGPSHTYTAGGTYVVTLVVNDGTVSSTPATTTATITDVNDPPIADPGGPYNDTEDVPVAFDGSGSFDFDGDPLTYSWDFGDASSDTGIGPSHTYTAGGTYVVTLVVNDGTVSSTPATTTATITDVNDPPIADPGGPYNDTEDVPVAFDGSGSSDLDGDPLTYSWDFGDGSSDTGDGSSDTGVGPSHTYTAGGTYTVTLVVNDGIVSSTPATTTATIADVNDPPIADGGGPYNGSTGVALAFDGSGSFDFDGDPLTYAWDFGDGNSGIGISPSHTYTTADIYTVALTVNDGTVSSTPATTTATISDITNNPPTADPGGPYVSTEGNPVTFDGSGSSDIDGDPLTYAWDFGDGNLGTTVGPIHTYTAAGTYTVTLTVNDGTASSTPATTTATITSVVEVRVGQAKDDSEESSTGVASHSSSNLEFMQDGSDVQAYVGMRFLNIAVPQGATIVNAYLELTTDETGSSPADIKFHAEDVDDAAIFSSSAFDISSRATTAASANWTNVPAWNTIGQSHQTPNLAAIIQEVVNRPGWASGNALAVLATSAGANNGPRTAESYNGSSANAALLHIEFTTGPDVIPPVRSNPQPTGTLPAGTTQTDISLDTNEDATCRHSTVPGTVYADMTDTFGVTGGTSHSDTVTGLADGGVYTFYAKCQDTAGNANTDDFAITFDVSDGAATIIEVRVGANKDDSEEKSSGANTYTSSDLEFMEDGGSVQAYVGMRWTNVTVPQGATILSAYLELTTDETGSVPADVEFFAEASDNAATFSSSNFDISSRAKTAASVVWANIPAWNTIGEAHQSTDISAIIQEVVDRSGWLSGNALAVLAASAGPNNGPRTAESYSGSSANAPLLHIEYTP